MASATLETTLLPGARALLEAHERELPQRDDLCGAFCGALALGAAGIRDHAGQPLDQDEVAVAAGSLISATPEPGILPHGERGRRDYRLAIPTTEDSAVSGTAAGGVLAAIERLSGQQLSAIPLSGPWTSQTLAGLFDLAAASERPVSLLANLATRHLWGARLSAAQVLAHLCEGIPAGPPPDWDVGHFACVFARTRGPAGSLYWLADTYPALGDGGIHCQPAPQLAAALDRRDMPAGGVIVAAFAEDAPELRTGAAVLGLREGIWNNGTPAMAA